MNIHKSQLFWCELQGYKVLTHCHIADVEMVQQHTTAKMVCKPCCKAQTQLPLGMSEARWQWSQRLLGVLFVCRNTMAKQFQIETCYTIPFKVLRPPRVVTYTPPPVTAATVPLTTNVPAQARDDWHGWWWHSLQKMDEHPIWLQL